MAEKHGALWGIAAAGAFVAIIAAMVALPHLMGPEMWVERPWVRAPMWRIQQMVRVDDQGRDLLLVRSSLRQRNGETPEVNVGRLLAVDLATGEITGERLSFRDETIRAHRPGQLWIGGSTPQRLFVAALPSLETIGRLSDLLTSRGALSPDDVADVAFPSETTSTRLLARDGFLWDLDADLKTLVRMHHDTPVLGTPTLGMSPRTCSAGTIALPSGRIAQLDGRSRRPALRVAWRRDALEMTEIETPHQGFLEGVFLCGGDAITLPPEDVFVRFLEDRDGTSREQVAAVSAAEGHRWTRGEADWLGEASRHGFVVRWATLAHGRLVLWVVRTKDARDVGDHFLLGVDPRTGHADWRTPL